MSYSGREFIWDHLYKTGHFCIALSVESHEQKYRQLTLCYLEKKSQSLGFNLNPLIR